jgi:hypothetical protein
MYYSYHRLKFYFSNVLRVLFSVKDTPNNAFCIMLKRDGLMSLASVYFDGMDEFLTNIQFIGRALHKKG